jgi:hypothetical protein
MPVKLASIIVLAAAASVHAACQEDGCNVQTPEDEVSLIQMQAKLNDPQLDEALARGKRELREYARSIIDEEMKGMVRGADYGGKKTNISEQPGPQVIDGWYGTGGTKCFLSKKSAFSDPSAILKCNSINDIKELEQKNVNSAACRTCLEDMRLLNYHGELLNTKQAQNTWGISNHNEPHKDKHGVEQKGIQATQTCWACDGDWKARCFHKLAPGVQAPDSFQLQQPLMTQVAQHLEQHGVNLYLDFLDPGAEHLIHNCGGRLEAFEEARYECFQDMMSLLKSRARDADVFLHWYGASGPFCQAEMAGGTARGKQAKPFVAQPIADMTAVHNGHRYNKPACYSSMGPNGKPFLQQVCEECGGRGCNTICNYAM